jgi:hypothetical protein
MLFARQRKGVSFSYSVIWLIYRSSLQISFLDNDVAIAELSYALSPNSSSNKLTNYMQQFHKFIT